MTFAPRHSHGRFPPYRRCSALSRLRLRTTNFTAAQQVSFSNQIFKLTCTGNQNFALRTLYMYYSISMYSVEPKEFRKHQFRILTYFRKLWWQILSKKRILLLLLLLFVISVSSFNNKISRWFNIDTIGKTSTKFGVNFCKHLWNT